MSSNGYYPKKTNKVDVNSKVQDSFYCIGFRSKDWFRGGNHPTQSARFSGTKDGVDIGVDIEGWVGQTLTWSGIDVTLI